MTDAPASGAAILQFPTTAAGRLSRTDREALARWAAGFRGVAVDFARAEDGHEYANISAAECLFGLLRTDGRVVVHSLEGSTVADARDLHDALAALARALPGSPRSAA